MQSWADMRYIVQTALVETSPTVEMTVLRIATRHSGENFFYFYMHGLEQAIPTDLMHAEPERNLAIMCGVHDIAYIYIYIATLM